MQLVVALMDLLSISSWQQCPNRRLVVRQPCLSVYQVRVHFSWIHRPSRHVSYIAGGANITRNPKVIWEELHQPPPFTAENNYVTVIIGYNAIPHIYPTQTAPSLRRLPPQSNTPIPRSTPLSTPNGIRIQSAVLPRYTFRTDRQADKSYGTMRHRHLDKHPGMTIRLTVCERDATDRPTHVIGDRSISRAADAK